VKRTALALLLVATTAAQADPGFNDGASLVIHVGSKHATSELPMNGRNPGLGLRYGAGWGFYHAGTFINSLENRSVYAGIGRTLWTRGPVAFSILAGGITGYEVNVAPALLPELSFRYGNAAVLLSYIPRVSAGDLATVPAVSLSLAVKF